MNERLRPRSFGPVADNLRRGFSFLRWDFPFFCQDEEGTVRPIGEVGRVP